MRFYRFEIVFLLAAVLASSCPAAAQETGSTPVPPSAGVRYFPQRWAAKADSARLGYDFPTAVDYYKRALEALDSTKRASTEEQLLLAQNGLSMMGFCSQPVVIARRTFSLEDFFLFYPLPDHSWRKIPNQLDSLGETGFSRATFIPEDAREIYYSAKDRDGIRNLYRTRLTDSLWSVPGLINEQLTSSSDEIYPMLSPDGKTLYFASKGLYGMGGYDLYAAQWNAESQDWDVPANLGFPYSSPYDDFLFLNTDDGAYSIFASNRACSRDSVVIYVLEYEDMPVRKAISEVPELRKLAALTPAGDPARMDNSAAVAKANLQNAEIRRYMGKMQEVRSLRDSVGRFGKALDAMRAGLASASDAEKTALSRLIAEKEVLLPALNDSLSRAVKALQSIEMDFLTKGVVLDADKLQAAADKEVVGVSSGYTFSKKSFGKPLQLDFRKPKPSFDYTFKILPEGRFAEDNTLPGGLVYQIQLFTLSRKIGIAELKGLSPVFERANPTRTFTYSAGLFRTYKDVLSNLNRVKRLGFRDAIITASRNGAPLPVKEARVLEAQSPSLFTVKIFPENGRSLPELAIAAIHACPGVEIIRSMEAGSVVFLAEPFADKAAAAELTAKLKALGISNTSITEAVTQRGL